MLKRNSISKIYEELDKAHGYMLRNDFGCEYTQKEATYVLEVHRVASIVLRDLKCVLDNMELVISHVELLENTDKARNCYSDFGLKLTTTNLGCLSRILPDLFEYNLGYLEDKLTSAEASKKYINHVDIQESSEHFEVFIAINL